jgi:hypothetical protein
LGARIVKKAPTTDSFVFLRTESAGFLESFFPEAFLRTFLQKHAALHT